MNPYEILGISPGASEDDIKKAYRKKAFETHPDRMMDDGAKFKEVTAAYEHLTNKSHAAPTMHQQPFGDDFDSVFNWAFKDQSPTVRLRRGQSIEVCVDVDFWESLRGCVKEVSYQRNATCHTCDGSGAKNASAIKKCSACNGTGVTHLKRGFLRIETHCSTCRGAKEVITENCETCAGSGSVPHPSVVSINVPAGIRNMQKIALKGQGDVAKGGAGNLYCTILVKEHPLLIRQENDIILRLPITYTDALLGKKVTVPWFGEQLVIDVPKMAQNRHVIIFPDKGASDLTNSYVKGNLLVQIEYDKPGIMTDELKKILSKMKKWEEEHHDSFTAVKEFESFVSTWPV